MNFATDVSVTLLTLACVSFAAAFSRQRREVVQLQEKVEQLHTEATQAQVELRRRAEMDAVKDEFISNVSHELRTPLTSIRGALGLLSAGLMGKVDDRAANLLRIASTNTDRLVRLINDILDLERMNSGTAPLQLQPCSVRDLVVQSVDTMGAMASDANVTLEIVPEPGQPMLPCQGDPDRLQQVLTNLLSNAIKFSPPGATIRVRTETRPHDLLVSVEDSGRGVPAEKLESVFERFRQVDPADSRKKGGTGLGLAICRTIMQQHGGQIWAERNDTRAPGRPGTTFSMRLKREELPRSAELPPPAQGAILIVDDDPGVRHVVAEYVRNQGFAVLETESGQGALQIAGSERLQAILMDLYMPGMTGWETIDRLKADPSTADIPVVVLSVVSPASGNSGRTPLTGKAQGWIQKPFNPGLLLAELNRVLHRGSGPARLLLVEHDAALTSLVLSSLSKRAQEMAVRVDHVASLSDAIRVCENQPPELLILDLNLPDGSGMALLKWLRRQPKLCALPAVLYSGGDLSPEELDQLRLGPTQFLTKSRIHPKAIEELVYAMVLEIQGASTERLPA